MVQVGARCQTQRETSPVQYSIGVALVPGQALLFSSSPSSLSSDSISITLSELEDDYYIYIYIYNIITHAHLFGMMRPWTEDLHSKNRPRGKLNFLYMVSSTLREWECHTKFMRRFCRSFQRIVSDSFFECLERASYMYCQ